MLKDKEAKEREREREREDKIMRDAYAVSPHSWLVVGNMLKNVKKI